MKLTEAQKPKKKIKDQIARAREELTSMLYKCTECGRTSNSMEPVRCKIKDSYCRLELNLINEVEWH